MDLTETQDPIVVGEDTAYEVRVTNAGSKMETNIQLTCTIPDKMELRSVQAPAGVPHHTEGKEIIFDVLPKLAPRADAIYRVNVRGLAPGNMRFRAGIKADGMPEPLLKDESTTVYSDEIAPH